MSQGPMMAGMGYSSSMRTKDGSPSQSTFGTQLTAEKSWPLVYSIQQESPEDIGEFSFVNSDLGWMIKFGELYRSENGGRTWDQVVTPMGGMKGSLWSFHLEKNGNLGWIAGGIYYPTKLGNCINNATGILPDNSYAGIVNLTS
jgi:hypothetical protein